MKRTWALPLVPIYALAQAAHGAAYRLRLARPSRLRVPVISVGSLSAGGAGKTPVVMMLAELIGQHHRLADVLSRGYRRSSKAVEEVSPALPGAAARFGDEPVEMASRGLRVFVGTDRWAAGRLAEQQTGLAGLIHLLDDGFQHRRLVRQFDIVLLTAADLADTLLPAGDLREPLRALRRADAVILRTDEASTARSREGPTLEEQVRRWTEAEIWYVQRTLRLPAELPERPFVFCGIARPEGFTSMLTTAGVQPAGLRVLADHHRYTPAELDRLRAEAQRAGANGFLTTEKDAVKLTPALRGRLADVGPVTTALLRAELDQESVRRFSRVLQRLP